MIEPPFDPQRLIDGVFSSFGLTLQSVRFLPIGFDSRSSSYEGFTTDHQRLYLKLRQDQEASETFSVGLRIASQVEGAIHPLPNGEGSLWTPFGSYRLMLFPFVEGVPGWDTTLTPAQWHQVGRTVRSLHELVLPDSLRHHLPTEAYSDQWRHRAVGYLNQKSPGVNDLHATALRRVLDDHHDQLIDLVAQAHELSLSLAQEPQALVCCHGDLHSGNFLVTPLGSVHPVDWDNLSWAPREKDLMFLGAGIGGMLDGKDDTGQFTAGYGPYEVRREALRYFRLERIVQDLVAFSEELLDSPEGGAQREVMFQQFFRQFDSGGVIDVALGT